MCDRNCSDGYRGKAVKKEAETLNGGNSVKKWGEYRKYSFLISSKLLKDCNEIYCKTLELLLLQGIREDSHTIP